MLGSGLLGGLGHCIGMCGPVVATYSFSLRQQSVAPHLLYNLGRITTYGILGGLVGLTGSFAGVVRSIERFQNITLGTVGTVMILMALGIAGWLPFPKNKRNGNPLSDAVAGAIKFISGARAVGTYFPMGLLLGFMPCGLLYTALIGAAGAGVEAGSHAEGFLRGMLMLFIFGLGTTPSMLLLGKIVSVRNEWLRSRFYKGAAVIMIVMGILFIYRSAR